MAHYAFIDDNNVVFEVFAGNEEITKPDNFDNWEDYYSSLFGYRCLRTSYNTARGEHNTGGIAFRGNYAGLGFTYDENLDAFIPPKPVGDWVLDEETFSWVEVVSETT